MMSEQEKKNENHEIKKTFVPFCRNNYTNVVDEKNVHTFDCLFEKGNDVFN